MKWFLRLVIWGTVLALPCYWLAAGYQHLLLSTIAFVLGLRMRPDAEVISLDLSAANALGLYAALCLSSIRTRWPRRLGMLAVGLLVLACVECLVGGIAASAAISQSRTGPWNPVAQRIWDEMLGVQHWVTVPTIWFLLLGRFEVPPALGPRERVEGAKA